MGSFQLTAYQQEDWIVSQDVVYENGSGGVVSA